MSKLYVINCKKIMVDGTEHNAPLKDEKGSVLYFEQNRLVEAGERADKLNRVMNHEMAECIYEYTVEPAWERR